MGFAYELIITIHCPHSCCMHAIHMCGATSSHWCIYNYDIALACTHVYLHGTVVDANSYMYIVNMALVHTTYIH